MPTLRTMSFRIFLYANEQAYDIEATIDVLRRRVADSVVAENIASLRRMQYGPRVENFMLDLAHPNGNMLIPLENWLHRYAVQVVVDHSDDDTMGSIDIDTDEERSVDTLVSEADSFDDVITETHYRHYGNRRINSDVVASFMNLRYGRPTVAYSVREQAATPVEEETIEEE